MYEQMFVEMRPRLLRLALLRGVPAEAIEDVVQETLLVAWKKLDQLYSPENVQFWLYEICRRVSARYLQSSSKASERQVSLFDHEASGDQFILDEAHAALSCNIATLDPADVFERQNLSDLLSQALHLLPDQARQAIESYYLLDLSQREVALRLGLSISALETRLHRARNRLRQILSSDIRGQAAAFDLPFSDEPARDWSATGMWCYYCGQHHLHGTFETLPDGQRCLRLRCPECSSRFGFDIVNGKGLAGVGDLRSFQPAFKRTMRELSRQMLQAVSAGRAACPRCGGDVRYQVSGPPKDNESAPAADHRLRRSFWLGGSCLGCGYTSGSVSADDAVYWSHPAIRAFIQRYPHWLNELDTAIEYQGRPAILFRLSDGRSHAELHVLTHRQTLEVLDIFERH